jgi:hypothetical protein
MAARTRGSSKAPTTVLPKAPGAPGDHHITIAKIHLGSPSGKGRAAFSMLQRLSAILLIPEQVAFFETISPLSTQSAPWRA